MRVLTPDEYKLPSGGYGGYFVPEFLTDDCTVAGAAIGLFCGVFILGLLAPNFYKNKPMISFQDSITCVLWTTARGLACGAAVDAIWYTAKAADQFTRGFF